MSELQMNISIKDMFRLQEKENGEIAVSGRELHAALEVKTAYKDWFPRMLKYGFKENIDYTAIAQKRATAQGNMTHYIDHALTLDAAKEISMIQRSEPGKKVRQYFIQVEKAWNSPEMIMQRALKIANRTISQLETKIEKDKPKIVFADAFTTSKTSILVGDLAKLLKQNGVEIGQRRLFDWLRKNGYLIRRKGSDYNMPTQYSMEKKLFQIKETSIMHADGHVSISKTPKVTGKGQEYFINKFLSEKSE